MSGWFDGSGSGTNNAFYGIGAGIRGRRNAQRQRYDRGFGAPVDPGLLTASANYQQQLSAGITTTNYKTYVLRTQDIVIGSPSQRWRTQIKKNGMTVHTVRKYSKGASINSAKDWVDSQTQTAQDNQLPVFTEASEAPLTDNSQFVAPFQPASMPADYAVGGRTVSAYYSHQAQKYFVTVRQGPATLDQAEFHQGNHAQAIAKYDEWKALAIERANYDLQESLSVDKGGYRIDLVVTQAASVSGFFNGILNMFGLGNGGDPAVANQSYNVPNNIQSNTTSMASQTANPAASGGQASSTAGNWKSMPTKTFAVRVIRLPPSNVSGMGMLLADEDVIKNTTYSTYAEAQAAYNAEVSTIENNPTHYDDPSTPLETEVATADGSGGDTTGDSSSSNNYNADYVDPALEQAAAEATAAAEAQAAADAAAAAAAQQQFEEASTASEDYTPPTPEEVFQQTSAQSAENYNEMTVDTSATYQTQTYSPTPVSTYTAPAVAPSSGSLMDNKVLLGAGAVTLVAGAYLLSRRN